MAGSWLGAGTGYVCGWQRDVMFALRRQIPGAFVKTQIPKGPNFCCPGWRGTRLPAPGLPGFRMGQFLLLPLWAQGAPKALFICPGGFEDGRLAPGSREAIEQMHLS